MHPAPPCFNPKGYGVHASSRTIEVGKSTTFGGFDALSARKQAGIHTCYASPLHAPSPLHALFDDARPQGVARSTGQHRVADLSAFKGWAESAVCVEDSIHMAKYHRSACCRVPGPSSPQSHASHLLPPSPPPNPQHPHALVRHPPTPALQLPRLVPLPS